MTENTLVLFFNTFASKTDSKFHDLVQEFIRESREGIGLPVFPDLAPMNKSLPAAEELRYARWRKEIVQRLQNCTINSFFLDKFAATDSMFCHIADLYSSQSSMVNQRKPKTICELIGSRDMIPDTEAGSGREGKQRSRDAELRHMRDQLHTRNPKETPRKHPLCQLRKKAKEKMDFDVSTESRHLSQKQATIKPQAGMRPETGA